MLNLIWICASIIGAFLIIYPSNSINELDKRNNGREGQLKAGQQEKFFEESRAIDAYRKKKLWPTRLLGIILVFVSITKLSGIG